jgi:hypothetical protein
MVDIIQPELCRHCGWRRIMPQKKNLCKRCYLTPGVRALYKSLHKNGQWANPGGSFGETYKKAAVPMPVPCKPGTPEKVEAMMARAERHEELFHERDGV